MTTSPSLGATRRSRRGRGACGFLSVALLTAACVQFPVGQPSALRMIPLGAAVVPSTPERSSFTVSLVAADGKERRTAGKGPGSVSISVRSDNVVVYALEISNVAGETFTQAQVVRIAADSSVDVVATLFADVMMRGRISVRGTASLARSLPPDALLAHMREHPGEYRVVVRGERHPVGSLTGSLGSSQ